MISKTEYFFLVEFVIVSNYLESVQPTSQVSRVLKMLKFYVSFEVSVPHSSLATRHSLLPTHHIIYYPA